MRFEFNCPLSKLQQSIQAWPNRRPLAEQYETPSKQIKRRQGDIPSLNGKQDVRIRGTGSRATSVTGLDHLLAATDVFNTILNSFYKLYVCLLTVNTVPTLPSPKYLANFHP